jgi:predicted CopG family antitoxin
MPKLDTIASPLDHRRPTIVLDGDVWEMAEQLMREQDRSFSSLVRVLIREKYRQRAMTIEPEPSGAAKEDAQ